MASTVYTESVVTLNATQAEATMNALKSSAEDLRKKMIEATKLGNSEDAARYQKELDNVRKSMSGITRTTKDYSDILKRLNGSTLSELQKAYSGLNKQLKNLVPGTKEFVEKSQQLKQVRARMDEVNSSVKGTNKTLNSLKGLLPKIGLASFFTAAAAAAVRFAKDTVQQTQLVGDRWQQFTSGMKAAYGTFVADLSSGTGWKELIRNMTTSFNVGKEVAAILDEIFERQNSLDILESEYNVQIEENKKLMRDSTKSNEERIAAAQKVDELERKLAQERKSIAAQEMEARKLELQDRTKMSDEDLERYVRGYNNNMELIHQAQEYNKQLAEAETNAATLERMLYQGRASRDEVLAAKDAVRQLTEETSADVREMAAVDARYQLSNDEMVQNYVKSRVKMNQADAEYFRKTTRTASTEASLKKELSKEGIQAIEDGYKAEISGIDAYQKEMETKAKALYADGTISERQYQDRLVSIQETAIKSKIAVAERYKKETVTLQSQLYDLTIQQQKELEKVLSDSGFATILQELTESTESEIEALMESVDEELTSQLQHLADLAEQADSVRASLDPKSALGQQLQNELSVLEEMHRNKLLSEEEYEKAKQNMIREFAKENLAIDMDRWSQAMDTAYAYFEEAGNAVSALQDAANARLDAQMEAELAAAGDNADAREEIESKYEQKKLDVQKKYAVADMVVTIAKTVAAGALATMQAFAQLGPIAGAAMAAVMAVTTAAQVATIVAQKNAIMNTSVGSSGASSGAQGSRVATGYSSGGYTSQAANDYQEVGVVHANEWVAPAAMVRANPVVFRRLEAARRRGTPVSGVSGFADGGMAGVSDTDIVANETVDPALLKQLNAVLRELIDRGVHAYVVLSELNAKQEMQIELKKITGK